MKLTVVKLTVVKLLLYIIYYFISVTSCFYWLRIKTGKVVCFLLKQGRWWVSSGNREGGGLPLGTAKVVHFLWECFS